MIICLDYSLTVKLEALHSYETSVNLYQSTWRHIPEYSSDVRI